MAIQFFGITQPSARRPTMLPPIAQNTSRAKVVPLRGAPPRPVTLSAAGPTRPRLPIVHAQAFARHLTGKPKLVAPTAPQRVGNAAAPTNNQNRNVTARRRQIAVRHTPGRIPSGRLISRSTSAGSFVFLSPAGRSTITGIVHRPPQPLVPVLAARAKSGNIFGQ